MEKNYIKVNCRLPFSCSYVFVDTVDHIFKRIMSRNNIKLSWVKEYVSEGIPYRLISCCVKKKDEKSFCEAVEQIRNSALLLGYKNYDSICQMLNQAAAGET